MKKVLLIIILITILLILGWVWYNNQVIVKTDRTEYQKQEPLRVVIRNNSEDSLCFSSCYPYYLEKKDEGWRSYEYGICQEADVVETCIDSKDSKTFGIPLNAYSIKSGIYRIAIPACINCEIGKIFQEDKKFHSNRFDISLFMPLSK